MVKTVPKWQVWLGTILNAIFSWPMSYSQALVPQARPKVFPQQVGVGCLCIFKASDTSSQADDLALGWPFFGSKPTTTMVTTHACSKGSVYSTGDQTWQSNIPTLKPSFPSHFHCGFLKRSPVCAAWSCRFWVSSNVHPQPAVQLGLSQKMADTQTRQNPIIYTLEI